MTPGAKVRSIGTTIYITTVSITVSSSHSQIDANSKCGRTDVRKRLYKVRMSDTFWEASARASPVHLFGLHAVVIRPQTQLTVFIRQQCTIIALISCGLNPTIAQDYRILYLQHMLYNTIMPTMHAAKMFRTLYS